MSTNLSTHNVKIVDSIGRIHFGYDGKTVQVFELNVNDVSMTLFFDSADDLVKFCDEHNFVCNDARRVVKINEVA